MAKSPEKTTRLEVMMNIDGLDIQVTVEGPDALKLVQAIEAAGTRLGGWVESLIEKLRSQ